MPQFLKFYISLLGTFLFYNLCISRTIHVGAGYLWTSPNALQGQVISGDTVIIHAGTYVGTFFLSDLTGTFSAPILIKAATGENVLFTGGTESFHFSDIAYVELNGLVIQGQTGNGMNIDDAGTFNSPSHHLVIKNCIFRNINASGNNDLLKLSGVDDFTVQGCTFQNGSSGGSGIDMVGCHRGIFQDNQFVNQGSNSIQIKGGSQDIIIRRCRFTNGGAREINIGGSTGLEFFRPGNATYEASKAMIYSNIFEGGETPFAFVGAVDCLVMNNTILRPGKWAMRILQETVDPLRFESCGRNTIQNNIFIITNVVSTEVNIGPDTAPNTFIFSNNLWFKEGQPNWSGPNLPVMDPVQIVKDPLINQTNFSIITGSPAYQKGKTPGSPITDYYGKNFRTPPSIGAVESESSLALHSDQRKQNQNHPIAGIRFYPNPVHDVIHIDSPENATYTMSNLSGSKLKCGIINKGGNALSVQSLSSGVYTIQLDFQYVRLTLKWLKVD